MASACVIKVTYLLWDLKIKRGVIKLLLDKFLAEYTGKLLCFHWLMCSGI